MLPEPSGDAESGQRQEDDRENDSEFFECPHLRYLNALSLLDALVLDLETPTPLDFVHASGTGHVRGPARTRGRDDAMSINTAITAAICRVTADKAAGSAFV
jgi:hypothetical protein